MIQFIDANCRLGRRNIRREGSLETTEELAVLMEKCGVEQAIVCHSVAVEGNVKLGNDLLAKEMAGMECFLKQWVVMPNVWDDFMAPGQLLSEMKRNDVRCVRMYPTAFKHSLKPYAARELINALTSHKVPIFIDMGQLASWDELYGLCADYPDARFVICDTGYRCLRWLCPILDACSNLYVETSTMVSHNGIRELCRSFGAERFLFGSKAPEYSLAAAVSLIRYSDITEGEKEKIAAGNLLRLLEEVEL